MLEPEENQEEVIEETEEELPEFRLDPWPENDICACELDKRKGVIFNYPISQEEIVENLFYNGIDAELFEHIPQITVLVAWCRNCLRFTKPYANLDRVIGKQCFDCRGPTRLNNPIIEDYCEKEERLVMRHLECWQKYKKEKKKKK